MSRPSNLNESIIFYITRVGKLDRTNRSLISRGQALLARRSYRVSHGTLINLITETLSTSNTNISSGEIIRYVSSEG